MIGILSNVGRRTRHRGGTAMAVAGYKPATTTCAGVADYGESPSCPNLESVNMLNRKQGGLRVTNPQGLKRLCMVLMELVAVWLTAMSQSLFGISTAIPEPNSEVDVIQEITLTFDLEQNKIENPSVTTWYVGCNVLNSKPIIALKKGEEIVAQISSASNALVEGNELTIKFDDPVVLEAGVLYTLYIQEGAFSCAKALRRGFVANCKEMEINYTGKSSDIKILSLQSTEPNASTVLERISKISFNFNEEISLAEGSKAYLYQTSNNEILSETPLLIGEDGKTVLASFPNIVLYNSILYQVDIPENSIFLKGESENGYHKISINYSGASYKAFGYSLVSPSNNKRLDNIGRVSVTVDCTEQEYLGRDFAAKAQLYKVGEDGETLSAIGDPIACTVDESGRGFYIDVYNFNLEPSSKYQVIVEADQFHLWDMDTQKPMRDTANEKMVFQYRTPDDIEPMPTQSFGAVTPSEADAIENLTSFRLDFEQYVYNSEFYYPVFVSYDANTLSVVDKTTGENVADFTVDIKWDDMNNYWLENVDPLDVTMLAGHEYEVTVPAGMFCCRLDPLREVSMNNAYSVIYKGGYATSFSLTYAVEGQATFTTEVARGAEVAVTFPENDGFKVASLTRNGEDQTIAETYKTPAIEGNTILDIVYEYAGTIDYDFSTGVSTPEDCPFKVYSEEGRLVIEGVHGGDVISIYNIGGLLMANLGEVPGNSSIVTFCLPKDCIYIIRINNKTLKVKH